MVTDQVWEAPIYPPLEEAFEDRDGVKVKVRDARPGLKKAEIVLFDHPVRYTKPNQPDAHARRIVSTLDGRRLEEVYLNRSYSMSRITGTYGGTNGRVVFADSRGKVIRERLLTRAGPFELWGESLDLRTGFSIVLEHLGADYADGTVTVAFRQEETEVSRV